jgi:hypothetical protein
MEASVDVVPDKKKKKKNKKKEQAPITKYIRGEAPKKALFKVISKISFKSFLGCQR